MRQSSFLFLVIVIIGMAFCQRTYAQTCAFTPSVNRVCLGSPVGFTPTFAGGTPVKYEWDFGNGKKDSVQKPNFKYNAVGTFAVNLKITFSGGATSNAPAININVLPLPVADITVESFPVQCYDGNYICIKDRSQAAGAPIKKRILLWGDGGAVLSAPLSQKDFCQSYGAIGTFTPVIEVTDTNGCISRKELKNSVKIAEDVYPSFWTKETKGCGWKSVYFYSRNFTDRSVVKKYTWDYGDGDKFVGDSSSTVGWDSIGHNYTTSGVFVARLIYEAYSGCIDTFETIITVPPKASFNFTWSISPKRVCVSARSSIKFNASVIPEAGYLWTIRNIGSSTFIVMPSQTPAFPANTIKVCGIYIVRLNIVKGDCDTFVEDTIELLGPMAKINNIAFNIQNQYQCVGDTAYFTPIYNFCKAMPNLRVLWEFGDKTAAKCTTDTKLGRNVGLNCNYSYDSINAKHRYPSGGDTCYTVIMTITDTISGCSDSATAEIVVGKPNSEKIVADFPRCFYSPIYFNVAEAKPKCNKERMWIMPDSICPDAKWEPIYNPYSWTYRFTCNSNRMVTVGFIVQNGNCYDTTWYHDMLYLNSVNGGYIPQYQKFCDSLVAKITMRDSMQQGIKYMTWDFDYGRHIIYDTLPATYSKLPSRSWTYTKPGTQTIVVTMVNDSGCTTYDWSTVDFGYYVHMRSDTLVCKGDTVNFIDSVRYFNGIFGLDTTQYWRFNPPGYEKIFWNFGDGNQATGPLPKHVYTSPGYYTAKMITTDRDQCWDTLTTKVRVPGTHASFGVSDTLFICGQIARFYDSSFVVSGLPSGSPRVDSIVAWRWDFGDGKTSSLLQNPYHDYTSYGLFQVTLTAFNTIGCYDTYTRDIRIQGPKPQCEIVGDTIGCVPFTARFKNTSADTKYWVWSYGDSTVYSTDINESVEHTFTKPGIYEISIYGVDSFSNPITQNKYFCSANYPDPLNPSHKKIRVYVLPVPQADFSFNQPVCVGQPVFFKDSSQVVYTHYRWDFPDGDSLIADSPVNTVVRVFSQPGNYRVTYKPAYKPLPGYPYCPDTISREVQVKDILASFEIDTIKSKPPVFFFNNTSRNSLTCNWNFGHPKSGSANFSDNCFPFHDYTGDTGYFNVCLTVMSPEGCIDSVCKTVYNDFWPFVWIPNVFTPDNSDNFNDAFDIPIKGEDFYHLIIYNRWGELVFDGREDGDKNDGINWNGKLKNTGPPCSSGTYFYIFDYHFPNDKEVTNVTGTITLIRPE